MDVLIPGREAYHLAHLVLDVNGTVAAGGQLISGVRESLLALRRGGWEVHWITADTRGRQHALDEEMGWPASRIDTAKGVSEAVQKADFVQSLGADKVVAIGNGANDTAMLRQAALGIAVLGPEGLALDALLAADVVASNIHAALEMVLDPTRLVATLRE